MRFPRSRCFAGLLAFAVTTVLAFPLPAFAGERMAERVMVEHAGFEGEGYAVEYVGVTDEGEVSEIAFKVRNTGGARLHTLHLEIEEWHEAGWLQAASSTTIWTALEPGEERLFTRPLRTPTAARGTTTYVLRRGDGWDGPAMASPREAGNGLSSKFAISTCSRYCDLCSDKAGDRCIGGVQEVSCSCNETSASCSYSCYPPPV